MKRALTSIAMFVLLGSLVAGVQPINLVQGNFFPDPGPDLLRIYIRNDGSIEPSAIPIERVGNLYRLTDDVSMYTIEIQCDNLVFDGSGCSILGNQSWMGLAPHHKDAGNNAIIIAGRNNVTITNTNFEKCTTGVRIFNSANIRITGNTFTKLTSGMGNALGVAVKDSSLVLIENNNFASFSGSAIACNGTNNIIKGNTITDIAASMNGNIDLEGSSNVVLDNTIKGMLSITLDRADSNIIAMNKISGPAPAPYIVDQNRTGTEGIALFSSCSNNIIFGNNITGFHGQAIRTVFTCSNNTIYGNYMANNGFAIALQDGAIDNRFYGNTFAADSCMIQINDGVERTLWDNGTIGNYWGDYNGTDSNGDCIGDTPYIVNGYKWDQKADGFVSYVSGQDNKPLIKPMDTLSLELTLPEYASFSPSPTSETSTLPSPSLNPNSPSPSPITASIPPSTEPTPSVPELTMMLIPVLLAIATMIMVILRRKVRSQ